MDEVLRDWKRLSLIGEEGERVILKKLHFSSSNEHVLAVGFMTRRALNVEAVGSAFKPL